MYGRELGFTGHQDDFQAVALELILGVVGGGSGGIEMVGGVEGTEFTGS